jgi:alkylhydroperoxidase family enzyme
MATVTLVEKPKGFIQRMAFSYSKKNFTKVVDPARAAANHSGVLVAMGAIETVVDKSWHKLDPHLRWLAVQSAAAAIGCAWCTDYAYFEGVNQGIDPRKIRDAYRWRDSDVYDERERAVLEFAECVTATPVALSDDLVRRLGELFTDGQITELVGWVALENWRSRFNAGMGLRGEGFSDNCELPGAVTAKTGAITG